MAAHRLDAAHLFRLALEKGATRAYYHGVAEEGVPFREIAEIIGHRIKVPVVSVAQAANHFGWFAHFAALDVPASSQKTQEILGWKPKQLGLIADLNGESYFKT
jgi:nucleoside-diphosphate-sugar epimerase